MKKFWVKREVKKWYQFIHWIIPWHFTFGSDENGIETERVHGYCWLLWTFYFKVI